jgi:hypothetical protein
MNMTIYKDQLQAVYRLIEKPENWTQGDAARGRSGNSVNSNGKYAVCWCLLGAAWRVNGKVEERVMDDMESALGVDSVADFNDNHTHAEVLALLQSAIDRAPERP